MTAIIRWNPERGLALRPFFRPYSLLEEVEKMAESAFGAELSPKLDMYEEDKELVVKTELPGIVKKDLDIKLDGDRLTITAEKKAEKDVKKGKYHTQERSFGRYMRYVTLPSRVDADKVTATLKKGLLEIRMPKAEVNGTKQIEIKSK
jgi:HSP20 family protein